MGARLALLDPAEFLARQLPNGKDTLSTSAEIIVLQVGNIYWLLAALAVLICFFSTPKTVRGYLIIIAIADLGHIWAVYQGMSHGRGGAAQFWDWRNWNDMIAGNVGASVFLCLNRVMTILGFWGRFKGEGSGRRVKGA
jgi:hypothetical protein